MKALIAFIVMAVGILALIEINERIKAKKSRDESQEFKNCPPEKAGSEDCSACELMSVCEKQKPTADLK